jgi:hypothetical protein
MGLDENDASYEGGERAAELVALWGESQEYTDALVFGLKSMNRYREYCHDYLAARRDRVEGERAVSAMGGRGKAAMAANIQKALQGPNRAALVSAREDEAKAEALRTRSELAAVEAVRLLTEWQKDPATIYAKARLANDQLVARVQVVGKQELSKTVTAIQKRASKEGPAAPPLPKRSSKDERKAGGDGGSLGAIRWAAKLGGVKLGGAKVGGAKAKAKTVKKQTVTQRAAKALAAEEKILRSGNVIELEAEAAAVGAASLAADGAGAVRIQTRALRTPRDAALAALCAGPLSTAENAQPLQYASLLRLARAAIEYIAMLKERVDAYVKLGVPFHVDKPTPTQLAQLKTMIDETWVAEESAADAAVDADVDEKDLAKSAALKVRSMAISDALRFTDYFEFDDSQVGMRGARECDSDWDIEYQSKTISPARFVHLLHITPKEALIYAAGPSEVDNEQVPLLRPNLDATGSPASVKAYASVALADLGAAAATDARIMNEVLRTPEYRSYLQLADPFIDAYGFDPTEVEMKALNVDVNRILNELLSFVFYDPERLQITDTTAADADTETDDTYDEEEAAAPQDEPEREDGPDEDWTPEDEESSEEESSGDDTDEDQADEKKAGGWRQKRYPTNPHLQQHGPILQHWGPQRYGVVGSRQLSQETRMWGQQRNTNRNRNRNRNGNRNGGAGSRHSREDKKIRRERRQAKRTARRRMRARGAQPEATPLEAKLAFAQTYEGVDRLRAVRDVTVEMIDHNRGVLENVERLAATLAQWYFSGYGRMTMLTLSNLYHCANHALISSFLSSYASYINRTLNKTGMEPGGAKRAEIQRSKGNTSEDPKVTGALNGMRDVAISQASAIKARTRVSEGDLVHQRAVIETELRGIIRKTAAFSQTLTQTAGLGQQARLAKVRSDLAESLRVRAKQVARTLVRPSFHPNSTEDADELADIPTRWLDALVESELAHDKPGVEVEQLIREVKTEWRKQILRELYYPEWLRTAMAETKRNLETLKAGEAVTKEMVEPLVVAMHSWEEAQHVWKLVSKDLFKEDVFGISSVDAEFHKSLLGERTKEVWERAMHTLLFGVKLKGLKFVYKAAGLKRAAAIAAKLKAEEEFGDSADYVDIDSPEGAAAEAKLYARATAAERLADEAAQKEELESEAAERRGFMSYTNRAGELRKEAEVFAKEAAKVEAKVKTAKKEAKEAKTEEEKKKAQRKVAQLRKKAKEEKETAGRRKLESTLAEKEGNAFESILKKYAKADTATAKKARERNKLEQIAQAKTTARALAGGAASNQWHPHTRPVMHQLPVMHQFSDWRSYRPPPQQSYQPYTQRPARPYTQPLSLTYHLTPPL